ncbi:acetyltransferase [Marinobacterium rhizophilum]|uniref:acetyltransferase n=1 Tax=Marinobacterium rhizophilum TaxID=420402 RepID=UPI0003642152|nr:acetyltransferase [Marinobacterium rhizophilum]
MKRLAILGASGHGKVLADMAELLGWQDVIFFDDAKPWIEKAGRWRVEGGTSELIATIQAYNGAIVAIGDNLVRLDKQRLLAESGGALISLVHPQASVSRYASIGAGSVVMAGAVINVDAHVGKGCIINTGATVDHDCELGDGVHLSPGVHLAGGVKVGRESWVGIGASVKQLVSIGDGVVVGAGAAVVQNLPDRCTALGVPARIV